MHKTLFNSFSKGQRLETIVLTRRCLSSAQNVRTIHTSGVQAAKPSKPSPKKTRKQQPLEYRPSKRPANIGSQSPATPKENPLRFRTIPVTVGILLFFSMGGYMGYMYYQIVKPSSDPDSIPTSVPAAQEDVSGQYENIARTFDGSVDSTEYTMGITSLRRKLVSQAKGDVLEVSIGTGRNLDFYDWNFGGKVKGKVRSLTAVDKSGEMLEIAHEKFSKMFPGILGVRWVIADASEPGKIPGPPKNANERSGNIERKYDTIIQTFGLCSVSDPVGLLRVLGDCVKEDEGRILLLEHGRGRWEWLNSFLDKNAARHAKEFGCWWNRDIDDIVKQSGLEVVKIETPKWYHGGTTWWVELKKPKAEVIQEVKKQQQPPSPAAKDVQVAKAEETVSQPTPAPPATKKGWW